MSVNYSAIWAKKMNFSGLLRLGICYSVILQYYSRQNNAFMWVKFAKHLLTLSLYDTYFTYKLTFVCLVYYSARLLQFQ